MPFLFQKLLFCFNITLMKQLTRAQTTGKEHTRTCRICTTQTKGMFRQQTLGGLQGSTIKRAVCTKNLPAWVNQNSPFATEGPQLLFVWMFCNLSYKHQKKKNQTQTAERQELFLAGFLAGTWQDFLHITYCEFIFIRIEEIVQVSVGHHQVCLVEQAGRGSAGVGSQALGICAETPTSHHCHCTFIKNFIKELFPQLGGKETKGLRCPGFRCPSYTEVRALPF